MDFLQKLLLVSLAFTLTSCGLPESSISAVENYDPDEEIIDDPFESVNRSVFAFNEYVDVKVLKPVAVTYRESTNEPVRNCVSNFFSNLQEPVRMIGHAISLDEEGIASSSTRFVFNTIGGGLGCVDVADRAMGVEIEEVDVALAIRSYTQDEHSLYLVLPFIGPTTMLDGSTAYLSENYLNPMRVSIKENGKKPTNSWVLRNPYDITDPSKRQLVAAMRIVDVRTSLIDEIEIIDEIAFDKYSLIREYYLELRAADADEIAKRRSEKY